LSGAVPLTFIRSSWIPEQVVGGAEADQVGGIVASAVRTKVDVMEVHRRPDAAHAPFRRRETRRVLTCFETTS